MITKRDISGLVGKIGYEILDEVIGPTVGISSIVADLYLADVETYTTDYQETERVYEEFMKHFDIKNEAGCEYFKNMPIALLALYVMENTHYISDNYPSDE
jgi:hypothetical protein